MRDGTWWPKALVFRPEHYVWPVTTIFKKLSKEKKISVNKTKNIFTYIVYRIRTLFEKLK